jgi:hypothetical protein
MLLSLEIGRIEKEWIDEASGAEYENGADD